MLERFHKEPPEGDEDGLRILERLFEAGWRRTGFGSSDDELQFRDRAREALRLSPDGSTLAVGTASGHVVDLSRGESTPPFIAGSSTASISCWRRVVGASAMPDRRPRRASSSARLCARMARSTLGSLAASLRGRRPRQSGCAMEFMCCV